MLEGESKVRERYFRQACVEILAASRCRLGRDGVEALKANDGERIDEVLLRGKMSLGRGVAHPQFTAQFAQRQLLDAARFQRGFGGAQQFLAQIAVVVWTGSRLHFRKITTTAKDLQDVVIDNKEGSGYIVRREVNRINHESKEINMRIFVTGATGFVGSAVVQELIKAGHQVLGLARSEAAAKSLAATGAKVHRGSLEDLDSLRSGVAASEGVIHLGFIHDFSKFQANCEIDKQAIEALGSVLAGSDRPLIVTGGTAGLGAPGQVVTEDNVIPPNFPFPRVSEQTALALIPKGVRASVMRLPQVHDTVKQGLVTYAIAIAREKGVSAYIGEGLNRWAAAHVSDVARLYRLALEKHETGARYHAVAEEGVRMKDIAETIGRGLKVPVKSISPEEAQAHFGWFGMFAAHDLRASSAQTQKKLGWHPIGPGLIADLEQMNYF